MRSDQTHYGTLYDMYIKEPQLICQGGMGKEQVNVLDKRYILVYNIDVVKTTCICCTIMDTWNNNKYKYLDILK